MPCTLSDSTLDASAMNDLLDQSDWIEEQIDEIRDTVGLPNPAGEETEEEIQEPLDEFEKAATYGTDCPGDDLIAYETSYRSCSRKCRKNPDCGGFVYTTGKEHEGTPCKLKTEVCARATPKLKTAAYTKEGDKIGEEIPAGSETAEEIQEPEEDYELAAEYGTDCPGFDLVSYMTSYRSCSRKCKKNSGCGGFVYTRGKNLTEDSCKLKTEVCANPTPKRNTAAYTKEGEEITDDTPAGEETEEEIQEPLEDYEPAADYGLDCPGYDLIAYNTSYRGCARKCKKNSGCGGFVYTTGKPTDDDYCKLKTHVCNNPTPKAKTAAYSKEGEEITDEEDTPGGQETEKEIKEAPEDFAPAAEYGMDCPGNDLMSYDTCFQCCARKCKKNWGCAGFVYTTGKDYDGDSCILKSKLCENPTPKENTAAYTIEGEEVTQDTPGYSNIMGELQGYVRTAVAMDCPDDELAPYDNCFTCCARKCDRKYDCAGFVYSIDGTSYHCSLKTKICDRPIARDLTVIYSKDPFGYDVIKVPLEGYILTAAGMDCPSKSIKSFDICYECCKEKCDTRRNCVGFVYSLDGNSDHCTLKKKVCTEPVTRDLTVVYTKVPVPS